MNDLATPPTDSDDADAIAIQRRTRPTIRHDIAAWAIMGAALVFVLEAHLLPALLAGLLMHELVHILTPQLRLRRVGLETAKGVSVAVLSVLIIAIVGLAVSGIMVELRHGYDSLPELLQRMADILEANRDNWPGWLARAVPSDAAELQETVAGWLRENARELRLIGTSTGRALTYILLGVVIGAVVALRHANADSELAPLARSLASRVRRLSRSFRRVVFAQVRISAVNTVFTWCYLVVVLPMFHVQLPLTKTMVAVTFIAGLMPVIGNLLSNTVIVIVSLSHSWQLALVSLGYLVVIHKLEWFLNAQIIGTQIKARAWEMLVAMLTMEAAFGLTGLVAAPIYYAYLKNELAARGLI
jgi:predicted PurR-regulated permease PerM